VRQDGLTSSTDERLEESCVHAAGFAHEALFYGGDDGFLAGTVPFVREGIDAGEAVLVAVPARRTALLQSALDGDAERVLFANMEELGRNPGRIIPAWRDFVDEHTARGQGIRGIGEPVWPERTADELVECQRHEALLNLAFGDEPPWALLCPYDTTTLGDDVIEEALRSHPVVWEDGRPVESGIYADPAVEFARDDHDLRPPPVEPERMTFAREDVAAVRALVSHHAAEVGLPPDRAADLILAASEAATNSVLHGGGHGDVAVWHEGDAVVCEVRDRGRISDPLTGRRRPSLEALDGRGLWVVHQLCDLVEVRRLPHGMVVRFRIAR
jgi:anti-sigma regulatory factor (Ser/Thr protein kinase)